jgi:hypothetical protein
MTLEEKKRAMAALLLLIEAERTLRTKVPEFRDGLPELWKTQIEGVRADKKDPKWKPFTRLTLGSLVPMLSPYRGINLGVNFLPPYADQYDKVTEFRNAIGHGDWEELAVLGGVEMAARWAESFYGLVMTCENPIASIVLHFKAEWPWPA